MRQKRGKRNRLKHVQVLIRRRDDRIRGLGYESYQAYIVSKVWKARRKAFFERNEKKCSVCDCDDKRLFLHHLTYERVGAELDQDLAPLCGSCHRLAHSHRYTFGLNLVRDLREIVQDGFTGKDALTARMAKRHKGVRGQYAKEEIRAKYGPSMKPAPVKVYNMSNLTAELDQELNAALTADDMRASTQYEVDTHKYHQDLDSLKESSLH